MIIRDKSFEDQVEHIIHTSEILAVVRALETGDNPRVGQSIDYYIEPEASGVAVGGAISAKRGKPYRAVVEQWHLDAAFHMIEHSRHAR